MKAAEYQAITERLGEIARMTLGLDLDGYLKAIERADSVGAILDPTLYRRYLQDPLARADLHAAREIATALTRVRAAALALEAAHDAADAADAAATPPEQLDEDPNLDPPRLGMWSADGAEYFPTRREAAAAQDAEETEA